MSDDYARAKAYADVVDSVLSLSIQPIEMLSVRQLAYSYVSLLAARLDRIDCFRLKAQYIRAAGYACDGTDTTYDAYCVYDAMERDHGDGTYHERHAEAVAILDSLNTPESEPSVRRILTTAKREHVIEAERKRARAKAAVPNVQIEAEVLRAVANADPITSSLIATRARELQQMIDATKPTRSQRGRPSTAAYITMAERALSKYMSRDNARALLRAIAILPPPSDR